MKIISWNVNGLRAVVKKDFVKWLKKEKPDILCLQEIKIAKKDIADQNFDFPGYEEYYFSAQRPGYSGTAILIKSSRVFKVKNYQSGIGVKKFDKEGRVQILDLGKIYLVNTYFPHSNHELTRLNFKLEFNEEVLKYVKRLNKKKPVILCGDFNVAHQEIDLARPKDNIGNPGFTDEERSWMTKFLKAGFVDTYRYFYPKKAQYSWWSYRFNARVNNIGWRIDYFCVSAKLIKKIKKAFIKDKVFGSDHCPVGIEIDF